MEKGVHQRQTMRDAIFGAMALHIFYRNADIVKMANQTQLTNLNQSLFDACGENFLRTPTFWVMKLLKEHIEQILLEDAFTADESIDAVATVSEDGRRIVLSAANKDLYKEAALQLSPEIAAGTLTASDIVRADDVRACNTYAEPNKIQAYPFETSLSSVVIPPHSVIRLVITL